MKTARLAASLSASVLTAFLFTLSIPTEVRGQAPGHVMENVDAAKWGPAPPMLPPGAQIAVLSGDPTKAVRYTVRLKFPANYSIPPHTHPEDENVTVVSGELFMQMGTKLDRSTATGLAAGGYALMPARAAHAAYTRRETTILLYGQGPVEFNYLNPSDDPRTRTSTRK